jgi:hypothetical protein
MYIFGCAGATMAAGGGARRSYRTRRAEGLELATLAQGPREGFEALERDLWPVQPSLSDGCTVRP